MLAQATSGTTGGTTVLLWVGALIGVVFLATVGLLIFRKLVMNSDKPHSSGMLMDDFRRLHATGKLSDAEFNALRTRMAARLKTTAQVQSPQGDTPTPITRQARPTQRIQNSSPPANPASRSPQPPPPLPPPPPPSPV